jgi:hypothetical protein
MIGTVCDASALEEWRVHEHDRQSEPEHRSEDKAAERFAEREDPRVYQQEPEGRTVPLRGLHEGRGDVPDVRHVEIARDGPLKRRRPGLAWIAAQ